MNVASAVEGLNVNLSHSVFDFKLIRYHGLSQELGTGCSKLSKVEFLSRARNYVFFIQGSTIASLKAT